MRLVARERPGATTSAVACAVWFPYRAWPYDRVLAWATTGYREFADMAAHRPEAGVRLRAGSSWCGTPAPSRGGPAPCPTW